MNLPIEMIMEIFAKDPSMHFNFVLLCKETSRKKPLYSEKDVLSSLGWSEEKPSDFEILWKKGGYLHSVPNKFPSESYDDGEIIGETWHKKGNKHRDGDLPATSMIASNLRIHKWYKDGVLHRDFGPAFVRYERSFGDGPWGHTFKYYQHGVLMDKEILPVYIEKDGFIQVKNADWGFSFREDEND